MLKPLWPAYVTIRVGMFVGPYGLHTCNKIKFIIEKKSTNKGLIPFDFRRLEP